MDCTAPELLIQQDRCLHNDPWSETEGTNSGEDSRDTEKHPCCYQRSVYYFRSCNFPRASQICGLAGSGDDALAAIRRPRLPSSYLPL